MKIRILDDTIRLRLDRSEVEALGHGRQVEATTRFADGAAFVYALVPADIDDPQAGFSEGRLRVTVPTDQLRRWAEDESAVSIRGEHGPTKILVEKDFECLEPRDGEDQGNRFRNPKALNT